MAKQTNTFQTILLIVFGVFILVAVIMFSVGGGKKAEVEYLGEVIVWGVLPERTMMRNVESLYSGNGQPVKITYQQKKETTFDRDLVEALASGVGPDVILLPQDLILRHKDKIYPIPYESLSVRDFKDRFIEEGELYLSDDGILALPLTVDPMVMYWNRDLLSAAGISRAPSFWDEFYSIVPLVTVRGNDTNITRSTISFGEFRNVTHAKEIMSMLIMQAGNPIIVVNPSIKDSYRSTLGEEFNFDIPPTNAALNFYTEFSNPAKISYSWNGSLPSSRDMFIAGDLAVYFGFASEYFGIKRKNPHLNFDIAQMPQTRNTAKKTTFGKMQGLAILNVSKSIPASFRAAIMLSDTEFVSALSKDLSLPPVRRDLLAEKPTDEIQSLFYDSAIISRAWLDPSPRDTENIFMNMVERVVSGRSKVSEAVFAASKEIGRLLK